MGNPPRDIKAITEDSLLRIIWSDQRVDFPFRFLRQQCGCARCINEWTGERILDPDSVPADVSIVGMDLVGNYAVRIRWSDGHDTGLYDWERLRQLTPSE